MYREWQAFERLTWSAEDKTDFRTKYLALHVAGNTEATIESLRMPWEPEPD